MTPSVRLLLGSAGAIYSIKVAVLAKRHRPMAASGWPVFLFAWPGVIPDWFEKRQQPQRIEPTRFFAAWARTVAGAASILLLAVCAPRIPDSALGLAGIAAMLLTIHGGVCDLLPWLLRWAGFDVPLLFDRPWVSASLSEFWSRRWNLAFVEMERRLFLRPLHRCFGKPGSRFALFAVSGLLHELAISFPAGAGWGLPFGYFILQGIMVAVEERFRIVNRAWTWFWVIAPLPWLFHEPFRQTLILPFYRWLHTLLAQNNCEWYLSHALWAAALGHFTLLIASVQLPARLRWKEEIAKLSRFNQKIFWVYGFYILLCIVGFGTLTWNLHDVFLAGEKGARWLAGFIAIFWSARVAIDFVWYDYRDWPPGNALVAGHALLTSLFCSLATIFWFTAFWRGN